MSTSTLTSYINLHKTSEFNYVEEFETCSSIYITHFFKN